MARARNIKPGFYKNEALAECSVWARFIFPGLWMLADREGCLEDRPKRIKAELLPFDSYEVEPLLQELHNAGLILRYEHGQARYIQVVKFLEHQHPHQKEPPSTIPKPGARTVQAPDKHRTDTGPTPDKNQSSPAESLLPLTESLLPEAGGTTSSRKNGARHAIIDSSPVIQNLPLREGGDFPVRQSLVAELEPLYPSVDVAATIGEMKGWLIGNPTKRKTKRGIKAFMVRWLQQEQEKASGV